MDMQKFRKRTAVVLSLVAVTALFAGGVAQAEETEAVSAQPAETSADSEVTSSETENKQ